MKILKGFIILLIIAFLGLFLAYKNGYYENSLNNKVMLTNEEIEQFESDLEKGELSLDNYHKKEKDYTTNTSKMSLKISNKIENIINSSIKFIFKKIGKFVE